MSKSILEYLEWSEEEYNIAFFDFAVNYAESQLTAHASKLISTTEYWVWYQTQFRAVDKELIAAYTKEDVNTRRHRWYLAHLPENTIVKLSDYVTFKTFGHEKADTI